MNIDPLYLQELVTNMKPRQKFYEAIKAELKRRGHWKALPRGKAPNRRYRYTKEDNPSVHKRNGI